MHDEYEMKRFIIPWHGRLTVNDICTCLCGLVMCISPVFIVV